MKSLFLCLGLAIFPLRLQAQSVLEETRDGLLRVHESIQESRERRQDARWSLQLDYSLLDTWIPSKYGGTLIFPHDAEKDVSWEVEYLKGSLSIPFFVRDLGAMTDEKYSLLRRSYGGRNSFNFVFGLTLADFQARLGDKYLDTVTGVRTQYELAQVRTLGLAFGFGQRWHLPKNWTFSIDWFRVSFPFFVLDSEAPFLAASEDPKRKDDLDDVLGIVEKLPSFTLGKISLGYHF